jgi:dihydrofolate reductase
MEQKNLGYNVIVAGMQNDAGSVGIGLSGTIPWKISEDMARFKKITTGASVIMGRKTWESIPRKFRPLQERFNIIVSTTMVEECNSATIVARNLRQALDIAYEKLNPVFIIGGESLYSEAISSYPGELNKLYFSLIHNIDELKFDTFFPLSDYIERCGLKVQTMIESNRHDFYVYVKNDSI